MAGASGVARPAAATIAAHQSSLEALRQEWAALHARLEEPTPFTHPSWHETWLRHFGEGLEPLFLAVRDGPELLGVAALQRVEGGYRQLGNHKLCDYAGPIAIPGAEPRVATAIAGWAAEQSAALEFWGLAATDPMRSALLALEGVACAEVPEAVCPRAVLEGGWEAYLAGLSKHDRHELRRKLRNFERAGQWRLESATSAEGIEAGLDTLFEHMRTSHDGKARFLSPAMEAFFRDLAATFAGLGWARLHTLWLDGRPAATVLALEGPRATYLYNSGYDPAFSAHAPGLVSKAYALRHAIDRGHHVFDFLRGAEEYKSHLGGLPCPVTTVRVTAR